MRARSNAARWGAQSITKGTFAFFCIFFAGANLSRKQLDFARNFIKTLKPARASLKTWPISTRNKGHSWIPLTDEEKQDYLIREKRVCKNPLHHCCLGQGRQLLSHHKNVSQLFTKWSNPLSNLSDVLDYMSEQNIPCNIWFVGFSMSGDHAIGALCELMRDHGYQLDSKRCIPYENPQWDEKEALNCSMTKMGMPSHFYQLVNPQRPSSCPKVTIAQEGMTAFVENYSDWSKRLSNPVAPYVYLRLGGVLVLNQGVHCNKRGCVTEIMKKLVEKRHVLSMTEHGWHILWRETEHQHFNTSNGYFKKGSKEHECRAIANPNNDYRNEEANNFLSDLSLTKNITIPVIPLAKASEALHFMHAYDTARNWWDCTHYVYSPWKFYLTWDGMLRALQSQS